MATSNEIYFDAAIRHQIGLRRFTTSEIRRISTLLAKADADLLDRLKIKISRLADADRSSFSIDRSQALLADIRAARQAALSLINSELRITMGDLSQSEVAFEQKMIDTAIPIDITFATVSAELLRAAVFAKPFQGKLMKDWFKDIGASDMARITQALQLGMVEGETVDQMIQRLAGTRANQYADGILSGTRANIETIVRTAINHTSNAARETLWQENSDFIQALRWTSTLDGRTSPVCRARDGNIYPVDSGPRPPAHPNCRSIMVAVLDGIGIVGKRPFVADTRTRGERETDFRALARQQGVPIQEVRSDWAARVIGQVPAETTYQQFLSRQSAAFQDEVLGKTKGALFRRGGLTLDQFIDRAGNELTLAQLQKTAPWAFEAANIR